jgi:hypothetical protein
MPSAGGPGCTCHGLCCFDGAVVIPYQVAQADRIQRDQTAREIYREFLNLTVQKPDLANADYCTLEGPGADAPPIRPMSNTCFIRRSR